MSKVLPRVYKVIYFGAISKEKITKEFTVASEAIALCRGLASANIDYRFVDQMSR